MHSLFGALLMSLWSCRRRCCFVGTVSDKQQQSIDREGETLNFIVELEREKECDNITNQRTLSARRQLGYQLGVMSLTFPPPSTHSFNCNKPIRSWCSLTISLFL